MKIMYDSMAEATALAEFSNIKLSRNHRVQEFELRRLNRLADALGNRSGFAVLSRHGSCPESHVSPGNPARQQIFWKKRGRGSKRSHLAMQETLREHFDSRNRQLSALIVILGADQRLSGNSFGKVVKSPRPSKPELCPDR